MKGAKESGTGGPAEDNGRRDNKTMNWIKSAAAASEPSVHHAAGRASIEVGFNSMMTKRIRIMMAPA